MPDLGRILLADDEESFSLSTAEILQEQGYHCDCASDAATAAEMLKNTDYDLLISDIKMPGNDNLELIKSLPQITEGLPVILVTGYASTQTAIQSVLLRVVAYLPKPFDYDELLKHVQNSIRQFRVYRIVKNMQNNIENWYAGLANIRTVMENPSGLEHALGSVTSFLDFTFKNIADALLDLNNLTKAVTTNQGEKMACNLLDCPRLSLLQDALGRVFETLEKTRGQFKSKELGELNRSLKKLFELKPKVKNQEILKQPSHSP